MKILYICTANVCRSKSAAALMGSVPGVEVRSAGSDAQPGMAACPVAPALQGRDAGVSQPLSPELIGWADLVLSAARDNQPAVVAMSPEARNKSFTIRQAARLSDWLVGFGMIEAARWRTQYPQGWESRFAQGDPRAAVQPLPDAPDRDRWFVQELDAARGMAPTPVPVEAPSRWWRRSRPGPVNVDDVLDAHTNLDADLHSQIDLQLREATASLARALAAVHSQ